MILKYLIRAFKISFVHIICPEIHGATLEIVLKYQEITIIQNFLGSILNWTSVGHRWKELIKSFKIHLKSYNLLKSSQSYRGKCTILIVVR